MRFADLFSAQEQDQNKPLPKLSRIFPFGPRPERVDQPHPQPDTDYNVPGVQPNTTLSAVPAIHHLCPSTFLTRFPRFICRWRYGKK